MYFKWPLFFIDLDGELLFILIELEIPFIISAFVKISERAHEHFSRYIKNEEDFSPSIFVHFALLLLLRTFQHPDFAIAATQKMGVVGTEGLLSIDARAQQKQ